ncbi:MAG: phospho-sugar mutase [Tissierellia bacterium]|nr:phospho-sugar mutase [Tissierellia bacterium]
MSYLDQVNKWLSSSVIEEKYKQEVIAIKDDKELLDRFYTELSFGTAGLRGKLGAGTNRMNPYTVGKATEGLARTICDYGEEAKNRGVSIAYDVRHCSREFADIAAGILAASGIRVYLFPDIRPTPMLSYAVRALNNIAGIVVTASHNPKDYNGYKVYWEEGSQILDSKADEILSHIQKITYQDIKFLDRKEGENLGLISFIGEDLDNKYYDEVINRKIRDEDLPKSVNVIYTPLNGTGNLPVREVLRRRGFNSVEIVSEQELPDGDFTTVGYPNPEDNKAFDLALVYAKEKNSDLIIATDPDCDRVSMMCKDKDGNYATFNGNQIGALLVNYILNGLKDSGTLPNNGAIVKSIVTGNLGRSIAESFSVDVFDTLTGFKYICSLPNKWDITKEYKFIFGYEESIGYVYGDYVRDKDAVISSMLIVEMADYYLSKGMTLVDALNEIYSIYGYHDEKLISLVFEGEQGKKRIGNMMETLRLNPLNKVGELLVTEKVDYLTDETGLEKSNVLKYTFDDGSWFALRPSGTEPKIKLYMYVKSDNTDSAKGKLYLIESEITKLLEAVE